MVQSCLPQPEHLFLNIIIIPSKPLGSGQACTASPTHFPEAPRHSQAARINQVLMTMPSPFSLKLHLCPQTCCADNAYHVVYGDTALRKSALCSAVSMLSKPMIIMHLRSACSHMCTITEFTLGTTWVGICIGAYSNPRPQHSLSLKLSCLSCAVNCRPDHCRHISKQKSCW